MSEDNPLDRADPGPCALGILPDLFPPQPSPGFEAEDHAENSATSRVETVIVFMAKK